MSGLARQINRKHTMEKQKLDIKTLDDKIKGIVDSANATLSEIRQVVKEQNKKIVELEQVQQKIATFAATEFGKIIGQQQAIAMEFAKSVDHIDLNVLVLAEISKEVFGQLSQIDHILQTSKIKPVSSDSTEMKIEIDVDDTATIENIKVKASEWYSQIVQAAFTTVQARRAEDEKKKQEALAAQQKAVEEAAQAKTEAELVEKELRAAESPELIAPVIGGQGADIPEGADVFGG